jgi:hypothetical protein
MIHALGLAFAGRSQGSPLRKLVLALTVAALPILTGSVPARATAEHDYKPNEYVIVDHGRAPNGQLAIAAHGEGEGGRDNFHLWLMAEPAHRRLSTLPQIGSDDILDSAAKAFYARWAPDSGHVAILFRPSRHDIIMVLYAVGGRPPNIVSGPSLLDAVMKGAPHALDDDNRLTEWTDISWTSPTTFAIKEHRLYRTTDGRVRPLGAFARQSRETHTVDAKGQPIYEFWLEFSAEATGELIGDRYRVRDLKPGKFEDDKQR